MADNPEKTYMPAARRAARTGNGWDARSDLKRARQETVLASIASGRTIAASCRLVGITTAAFDRWRNRDPKFLLAFEMARDGHRPPKEQEESFRDFRLKHFGMETFPHQREIVHALDTMKPRDIIMINVWPESGKTSTLEDWICQQLAQHPNLRITDVSSGQGLPKKTTGKLQQRMTDERQFPEYIGTYGPFREEGQERKGKPWAATHFVVAAARNDDRDYSFEARGIVSKAYGTRMDILLVDDIQARETLGQTKKFLDILRQTYFTRGHSMKTVIIGTRIDIGDIYEKLDDAGIVTKLIRIPAVRDDGTVTCPELWGIDRADYPDDEAGFMEAVHARIAKIRKDAGEQAWWASYQQLPQADQLSTFTEAMIDNAKDPDRVIGAADVGSYVALSVDPALGGGNVITAAVHGVENFTILDQRVDYSLARNEEIFAIIENFAQKYHPQLLILEQDGMQKGLGEDDRLQELGRMFGFQIIPHRTSRNKVEPQWGVRSMASSFILGEVSIPWGDEEAQQRMDPLVGQLRAWRSDVATRHLTQDAVMSLWFNWRHWKMNQPSQREGARDGWKRQGMPYTPTTRPRVTV